MRIPSSMSSFRFKENIAGVLTALGLGNCAIPDYETRNTCHGRRANA